MKFLVGVTSPSIFQDPKTPHEGDNGPSFSVKNHPGRERRRFIFLHVTKVEM